MCGTLGAVECPRKETMERHGGRIEGKVTESLPNALYAVTTSSGTTLTCHVSTGLKRTLVSLIPGDDVEIEVSTLDPTRGRITRKK